LCLKKREKAWDEGWGLSVGEQGGRKGTGRKPTEPPSPNRIFGKTSVGEGHYKTRTQMVRERGNQKYDKPTDPPFPKIYHNPHGGPTRIEGKLLESPSVPGDRLQR
jgi:hypothetical protein